MRLGTCSKFRIEPRRQPQVLGGSHQPAASGFQRTPMRLVLSCILPMAAKPAFDLKRQPAKPL